MTPSFSLKWLFVVIAFVAFLLQSIALIKVVRQREYLNSLVRMLLVTEQERVRQIEYFMSMLQLGDIRYSSLVDDDGFHQRIYGQEGTLNEAVAGSLLESTAVEVWLDNTTVAPEAMKTMLTRFEHERVEPSTDHFLRRGHTALPRDTFLLRKDPAR